MTLQFGRVEEAHVIQVPSRANDFTEAELKEINKFLDEGFLRQEAEEIIRTIRDLENTVDKRP